jgi:hypothetical protein
MKRSCIEGGTQYRQKALCISISFQARDRERRTTVLLELAFPS